MDSPLWVYLLGLVGMAIYGVRIVVQWYLSEKAHEVVSPGIYWVMSSIGAVVLYIYGWLRKDFSIIFGESIGYYIYMWNIALLGMYKNTPKWIIIVQALFPVAIIGLMLSDLPSFTQDFLFNENVPPALLALGVIGQFTYEIRGLYQLVYSLKRKQSILPLGHWLLAVAGSVMIIAYGIIRHDWVLVIGQFAVVFSIRNIMIHFSARRRRKKMDNESF